MKSRGEIRLSDFDHVFFTDDLDSKTLDPSWPLHLGAHHECDW